MDEMDPKELLDLVIRQPDEEFEKELEELLKPGVTREQVAELVQRHLRRKAN